MAFLSPALNQQYRIIQYSLNDKIMVGAAHEYLNAGDADPDVDRGPLAGRLEVTTSPNDAHFFALNLSWSLKATS